MTTAVHHTAGRRAVVPGFVLAALVAVAVVAFAGPALRSTSTSDAPAATHAAAPSFPREVRVADLGDATLRETALQSNPPLTALVEVAPGVYARPHAGALGSVGDYRSVFGRCAAVNRYAQTHVVARACW
jgi:hypothetical protein